MAIFAVFCSILTDRYPHAPPKHNGAGFFRTLAALEFNWRQEETNATALHNLLLTPSITTQPRHKDAEQQTQKDKQRKQP